MIDRYTKVCLTVIAVSLAVIGLRGLPLIDPAWAGKLAPFEATPVQCAEIKRISSNWLGGHRSYQQTVGSSLTLEEEMMRHLAKAEGFATIYNAFCKD